MHFIDWCLEWKPDKPFLEPSVCVSIESCLEAFSKHEAMSPFSHLYEHSLVNLQGKFHLLSKLCFV